MIQLFIRYLLILGVFLQIRSIQPGKILFMYPHASRSHLGSMKPLIKVIIDAGHDVTVLQSGTSDTPDIISNESVVLWRLENVVDEVDVINQAIWNSIDHSHKHFIYLHLMETFFGENIRQMPEKVRELLNQDWDLLVCDGLFTNHGFAFAQLLKRTRDVPYVVFDTTFIFNYQTSALAFGGSWSAQPSIWGYLPENTRDVYLPNSIQSRLPNFLELLTEVISMNALAQFLSFQHVRKISEEPFTIPKFMRDCSLLLTDEIRGFGQNTPKTSRVQVFSSYCSKPSELPSWLAEFVEDEKSKGTVYIAFGTLIQFTYASESVQNNFFDALNELSDYRVVLASKSKISRTLKSHIKHTKWAPQVALLSHPKTKLFISHGGLKSFKEAVCAKCPMTIMPFFAEQGRNAMVAAKMGIATILNKFTIKKETMVAEILKVLENDEYAKNIGKFHDAFIDNPIDHMEEVKFRFRQILNRKGKNLRHENRGETMYIFYFFSIDQLLILLIFMIIVSSK